MNLTKKRQDIMIDLSSFKILKKKDNLINDSHYFWYNNDASSISITDDVKSRKESF